MTFSSKGYFLGWEGLGMGVELVENNKQAFYERHMMFSKLFVLTIHSLLKLLQILKYLMPVL